MTDSLGQTAGSAPPRVWLVVGEKRGDNAQIRNLARAVGWPVVEKSIVMKPEWVEGKPPVEPSIDHVDLDHSDALEGPWPDLVITAGRRLASVALHVKRVSGGHTKIVVIGKPRGRAADFDLIVIASHYVMAEAANVARHDYPLMTPDHEALTRAKAVWDERLAKTPRPITAVFVGGPTGGLRFGPDEARALVADARRLAGEASGSLYIVTSRRTPERVVEALRQETQDDASAQLALYDASLAAVENPYQGLLASADHFVVTTDSLSMMIEVAQLGRPLSLFPLTRATTAVERVLEAVGLLAAIDPTADPIPAGGVFARTLAALGRPIHARDLSATSRRLVANGLAAWSRSPRPQAGVWADEALTHVAARIRALVVATGNSD